MDVFTHVLVPYAAALAAFGWWRAGGEGSRSKAAAAAVIGIAGVAPDVDGAFRPLVAQWDALYFLQHRGLSHTLVGAPLFGIALVAAFALLARWWPARFGLFTWRPWFVPVAALGSLTHLLLDGVTYAGVPLLWPFRDGRASFQLFGWLVAWMFPVAGIVLALHAFRKLSRASVVRWGAAAVVALLVLGGVRAWERPSPPDALVFPRSSPFEWTLLREHGNGTWEAWLETRGERGDAMWFEPRAPAAADRAVARARDTDSWRGFAMGSFGPVVVRAEREGDAWNVTFTDVAQRFEALHDPSWTPTSPENAEWGYVAFLVRDDGRVEETHRGW